MQNIFLNWKQNGSYASILSFVNQIKLNNKYNVVLFLPFPYLFFANGKIITGAQNVSHFKDGAYTGEVGASMLQEVGVKYCLIGHSERRALFEETSFQLKEKIKRLKEHNITPILCVGESQKARKDGNYLQEIERQMSAFSQNVIVAYEPIWSIGTGLIPSTHEIAEVALFIKKAYNTEVLYGGSVNEANAKNILSTSNINGVLVGGASLNVNIINSIIL